MPVLTANTLFHFTKKKYLLSILTNGIAPRYCSEFDQDFDEIHLPIRPPMKFPMACFCDIPLSQIKDHIDIYGSYGIGLSKEWGKQKGLNPILYLQKFTKLLKQFDKPSTAILKEALLSIPGVEYTGINKPKEGELLAEAYNSILPYVKPYSSSFYRKKKNYIYYNEREWRFSPVFDEEDKKYSIIFGGDSDEDIKNKNDFLKKYTLSFEPEDLKYIILNDEKDVNWLREELLKKFKKKYKNKYQEVINHFMTSVITNKKIREDF